MTKRIFSIILILSMLLCATVPAFASETTGEEYISELRLIYADDYEEAKGILADSEFSDYKLFNENLNKDSDEIGVWIAYKTTSNIEDAITDLAVMQMNGGYTEGNYQELIRASYEEYAAMGEIYLQAIEYFVEAYDAGDFLAESAFRQLNFYNIVSEGVPEEEIPDFEGERLGDIFYEGIDKYELATMFFQGNSYVLTNVRSLITMGVSYNDDGMTYLEKVGEAAAEMNEDATVFDSEDYDTLASVIAPTITSLCDIFKELGTVEAELNYEDEEYTDLEIYYLEYKALAEMMRKVNYLDDKTFYQFCLDYVTDEDDYSALYPLVAALNDGQAAMTKVNHFYDVIRYSSSLYAEEYIEAQLAELEKEYGGNPFNLYTGVDRTVYYGTFAVTSAASRADAYTESGITEALFGEANKGASAGAIVAGTVGAGLAACGLVASILEHSSNQAASQATQNFITEVTARVMENMKALAAEKAAPVVDALKESTTFTQIGVDQWGTYTYDQLINNYMAIAVAKADKAVDYASWTFAQKVAYLDAAHSQPMNVVLEHADLVNYKIISNEVAGVNAQYVQEYTQKGQEYILAKAPAASTGSGVQVFIGAMYIAGGILMLYSAIRLGLTVYNYYHPDYEDVPLSMVDLVDTVDGDRYIKYDVVMNAETNKDGVYEAGDLNAFEGQRWNALYYTKSYEAGKPLLADAFSVSTNNNQPKTGYSPVHRFGEVVCYDLNKYNFDGDTKIYLCVKQSKDDKSSVADVPEVVGTMFGTGFLLLAGGIGLIVGIGATVAMQGLTKKKESNADVNAKA